MSSSNVGTSTLVWYHTGRIVVSSAGIILLLLSRLSVRPAGGGDSTVSSTVVVQ